MVFCIIIASIITVSTSSFALTLYVKLNFINIDSITYLIYCAMAYTEQITTLFFIVKQVLIAKSLVNSFTDYCRKVLQQSDDSTSSSIDIELMRQFYNELDKTINTMRSWVSVYYGLVFFTGIPICCAYLYVLLIVNVDLNLLFLSITVLLMFLTLLASTTSSALLLHNSVRFTNTLYKNLIQ